MPAPANTFLTNDVVTFEALDILENTYNALIHVNSEYSDQFTFGVTIAGLVPTARAAAPAWTPPPPPYAPVGASSPTTPTPSSELAKKGFDYDASGYRAKRAAERGIKSRY